MLPLFERFTLTVDFVIYSINLKNQTEKKKNRNKQKIPAIKMEGFDRKMFNSNNTRRRITKKKILNIVLIIS